MHVRVSVLQFKIHHFWKTHYIPHLEGALPVFCSVVLSLESMKNFTTSPKCQG